MHMLRVRSILLSLSLFALLLATGSAQTAPPPDTQSSSATLKINTRAVLVDVLVSDRNGAPVTGLKQDAFTVTEEGKPQAISFFEEHKATPQQQPVEIPKLPVNVFTNFSPIPLPPAVNVLLLDSLNTRMDNQSFVHAQAMKFLRGAKPGSRMAIFTMALGLHFVQGFTDDPAVLVAALGNRKNNEVQSSEMIKGQEETNAQQNVLGMMSETAPGAGGGTVASADMIAALQNFFQENDDSRSVDRAIVTLTNLQRLATFLNGFPGRKNVIWFTESVPWLTAGHFNPQLEVQYKKAMEMLTAARVALYPVDAAGVETPGFYQASNSLTPTTSMPGQMIGGSSAQTASLSAESSQRNSDQETLKMYAHDSGGKAFVNTNGLSEVIADINSSSADFYTLSYTPTNSKMDGTLRAIEVKVAGGKYSLSYRRSYYASDEDLPGAALAMRAQVVQRLAAQNPGAVDPLLPFMDLGMPQTEQILFKALIKPLLEAPQPPTDAKPATKAHQNRYSVDFAIDLKDLDLKLDSNGLHNGMLNLSLIVYDRYGQVATREDHLVVLNIKPDVYAVFQKTGVQLHAEIRVPKGQYWLRTGVYDQASHKVGTLEVPLAAVVEAQK
jgi:VWFA-related protein